MEESRPVKEKARSYRETTPPPNSKRAAPNRHTDVGMKRRIEQYKNEMKERRTESWSSKGKIWGGEPNAEKVENRCTTNASIRSNEYTMKSETLSPKERNRKDIRLNLIVLMGMNRHVRMLSCLKQTQTFNNRYHYQLRGVMTRSAIALKEYLKVRLLRMVES